MNVKVWLFCILAIIASIGELRAQPIVYLVRHAEKLAGWPTDLAGDFQPLSRDGLMRAERLVQFFADQHLAAIYSSLTTRTMHTAFPLSQSKGVPIQIVEACQDTSAIAEFLAELRNSYDEGQAVLLVSHSNIIPYVLIKAGLPEKCWQEMRIHLSKESGWLLINGYDNVWKIDKLDKNIRDCGNFRRLAFE